MIILCTLMGMLSSYAQTIDKSLNRHDFFYAVKANASECISSRTDKWLGSMKTKNGEARLAIEHWNKAHKYTKIDLRYKKF